MKKKILLFLMATALVIGSLCGCGGSKENNKSAALKEYVDDAGRTVELPENVEKVIPTGTMAQMFVYALNPDAFAGVVSHYKGDSEKYMSESFRNAKEVGQLYGGKSEANLETIIGLDADLIIDVGEAKDDIVESMDSLQKKTGIPCIHIEADFESMPEAFEKLGQILDKNEEAKEISACLEKITKNADEVVAKVGSDNLKSFIYDVGVEGLSVVAKGSYHAEVLEKVANNAAILENASSNGKGDPVDMEKIISWNPDVVIFAPNTNYDDVKNNELWQSLDAVKNGRYVEAPSMPENWLGFPPSVQIYLTLVWVPDLLYPEETNYDVYDVTKEFYDLIFHIDLTKAEFSKITERAYFK